MRITFINISKRFCINYINAVGLRIKFRSPKFEFLGPCRLWGHKLQLLKLLPKSGTIVDTIKTEINLSVLGRHFKKGLELR